MQMCRVSGGGEAAQEEKAEHDTERTKETEKLEAKNEEKAEG
jgi:hypothetical protein